VARVADKEQLRRRVVGQLPRVPQGRAGQALEGAGVGEDRGMMMMMI
jgi:hypothetical protein